MSVGFQRQRADHRKMANRHGGIQSHHGFFHRKHGLRPDKIRSRLCQGLYLLPVNFKYLIYLSISSLGYQDFSCGGNISSHQGLSFYRPLGQIHQTLVVFFHLIFQSMKTQGSPVCPEGGGVNQL